MVFFFGFPAIQAPSYTASFPISQDGSSFTQYDYASDCSKWVDRKTGEVRRALGGLGFSPFLTMFSPDGRWLASMSVVGAFGVWNLATGATVIRQKDGDYAKLNGVYFPLAFSPDSTVLAVGNWMPSRRSRTNPERGIITFWDLRKGTLLRTIRLRDRESVSGLVFLRRRSGLTVRISGMSIIDYDFGAKKLNYNVLPPMAFSRLSEDGTWAIGDSIDWIDVWDIARKHRIWHFRNSQDPKVYTSTTSMIAPGGKRILLTRSHLHTNPGSDTGYTATSHEMRELPSGKLLWSAPESMGTLARVYSPDGAMLEFSNGDIRDTLTGEVIRKGMPGELALMGPKRAIILAHAPNR